MADVKSQLAKFTEVATHPKDQMEKYLADGRRIIGVSPYYVPEELAYAAGAVPFGVWGCEGEAEEARKYFPPFFCSIAQMSLEMGLTHKLDKLSGIMVSVLCDTLRDFSQNWKAGVSAVPMIFVSQPQNRFTAAGLEYCTKSYEEVKQSVQECCHHIISDDELFAAIKLYNQWRKEMRTFLSLAGKRPKLVSVSQRCDVVSAGYFMDKAEHLEMLRALNAELASQPEDIEGYHPIVLSGIYEDIPEIQKIMEDNKFTVVADDLAKESRSFAMSVSEAGDDPVAALAAGFCAMGNDSILYDPQKNHLSHVVDIAKESGAKGVVILLAKFCDPEEFDAPYVAQQVKEAGLQCVIVEVDQSTETYGQAQTQFETFASLL